MERKLFCNYCGGLYIPKRVEQRTCQPKCRDALRKVLEKRYDVDGHEIRFASRWEK